MLPAFCRVAFLLASLALLCSCKPAQKPNTEQADQRAMWLDSVPQLKSLNVSNAEISRAHPKRMRPVSPILPALS